MNGFISYAHEDIGSARTLCTHLTALQRSYDLRFWMDPEIAAGRHWRDEISDAIEAADVFLLLCTPNFIASEYIYTQELPAIRKRHKAGALAITVVLESSFWQMIAGALQAVPTADGELVPVSDWRPRKKGFDQVRQQIGTAVESYFEVRPKALRWWRR